MTMVWTITIMMMLMLLQVGPGDDYVLTVGGFDTTLSTLKDMNNDGHVSWNANGMKFSTK